MIRYTLQRFRGRWIVVDNVSGVRTPASEIVFDLLAFGGLIASVGFVVAVYCLWFESQR